MKLNIVGIDPSLRNFGIAKAELDMVTMQYRITDLLLIDSEGDHDAKKVVRRNSDDLRRARNMHKGFMAACRGASLGFAEVPVGSQSARAMASYGICVGVLASSPIPLIEVKPDEVKMAAVGDRTAAKEEMIQWASERHPYAPWIIKKVKGKMSLIAKNEHLADAVAAIEAGLQTEQFKQLAAMMSRIPSAA